MQRCKQARATCDVFPQFILLSTYARDKKGQY